MGLSFSLKTTGGAKLSKKLSNLGNKAEMTKAMTQVGLTMVSSIKAGFEKQKAPKGESWPELGYKHRPDTDGIAKFWKKKYEVDSSSKALINTGESMGSLTYQVSTGGTSVLIGYGVRDVANRMKIQQFGITNEYRYQRTPISKIKSRNMTPKKRPQMGFATWRRLGKSNDYDTIKRIFQEAIQKGLKS